MKRILTWLLVGLSLVCMGLLGQGEEDPFDISGILEQIEEYGVPTCSSVAELEAKAMNLFTQGNYVAAMEALEAFAKHANWLANIIVAGLEPFYGASYDDRKSFPYYSRGDALIEFERRANEYKTKRNHAMVMQAECAVQLGVTTQAVAMFMKALDLIDIEDYEWWDRARDGLYALIELR